MKLDNVIRKSDFDSKNNEIESLKIPLPDIDIYPYYYTNLGICFNNDCEIVIDNYLIHHYKKKINLILTSPPFPLQRKKKYGNKRGDDYIEWLCRTVSKCTELLKEDGSLVIEMGNAWESGSPTYSVLPIETLLEIKKRCNLNLCQEFIYYNPARLPGPIEWVNKKRVRVKDAFTRIWWFSMSKNPYADNRNVLDEYSKQMQKLLQSGKYNAGRRPSEHKISEKAFLNDHGGAIPSNVIIASNTMSKDPYIKKCKENNLELHPARMVPSIPEFFIKFLTRENDIVFDCFSGSNVTGYTAEKFSRRWLSTEIDEEYFEGSQYRFPEVNMIRVSKD